MSSSVDTQWFLLHHISNDLNIPLGSDNGLVIIVILYIDFMWSLRKDKFRRRILRVCKQFPRIIPILPDILVRISISFVAGLERYKIFYISTSDFAQRLACCEDHASFRFHTSLSDASDDALLRIVAAECYAHIK